jgi:DinB superfamily
MLDFRPVRAGTRTLQELAGGLTKADLAAAANALYDDVLARIGDASDADITFEPVDPIANDEFAADTAEVALAWTLGHVVVHLTASAEEAAFIAAELARGVAREGRSRWETPWPSVTTAAAARARLDESRRMLLATLAVWPDQPHLDVAIAGGSGPRNAIARFASGLSHADSHLDQVSEVVRQARAARNGAA